MVWQAATITDSFIPCTILAFSCDICKIIRAKTNTMQNVGVRLIGSVIVLILKLLFCEFVIIQTSKLSDLHEGA